MSGHQSWRQVREAQLTGDHAQGEYLSNRRMMTFGEEVRRRREARGMTQADLAARLKRSVQAVDRLEFGDLPVTASLLRALNTALGCELDPRDVAEPSPAPASYHECAAPRQMQ